MEASGVERWQCAVCGDRLAISTEVNSVTALGVTLDLRSRPAATPTTAAPAGHGWCASCAYWRPLERAAAAAGLRRW